MNKENNLNSFYNKIVKKPWGKEYLIFQNNVVDIWLLSIEPGKNTSLHCHPTKKNWINIVGWKNRGGFRFL